MNRHINDSSRPRIASKGFNSVSSRSILSERHGCHRETIYSIAEPLEYVACVTKDNHNNDIEWNFHNFI